MPFNMNRTRRKLHIAEQEPYNIFTPGIYHGSTDGEYRAPVDKVDMMTIIALVKERALMDGEWCIDMGLVGSNEPKMRKMMEYVSDPNNIKRCVAYQLNNETGETIDFVCRDLANGSKWVS